MCARRSFGGSAKGAPAVDATTGASRCPSRGSRYFNPRIGVRPACRATFAGRRIPRVCHAVATSGTVATFVHK